MKYTVYLLRHGQTFFNRYNKMQGWSDSPLTPEGEEVARQAAKMFLLRPLFRLMPDGPLILAKLSLMRILIKINYILPN